MRIRRVVWGVAGGCLLGVFLTLAASHFLSIQSVNAKSDAGRAYRSEDEQRTIDVYRQVNDAVVFITTTTLSQDPFDAFLGVQPREGSGSGVVVDGARGIVVTNFHVIKDADAIDVTLGDGNSSKAALVGLDPEDDLAIIRLVSPPPGLPSLAFADSSQLEVGQQVIAIGNPFGLNRTLTIGVISSLNRNLRAPRGGMLRGLIQTDAAINPGNSGGPLLDMDGRLVGINSAILSSSGDSAGIGFAVPSNVVRRVLPELISKGRVSRPELGWVLVDTTQGPMVYQLVQGSPAHTAGIQPILRKVSSVFAKGYVRDISRADLIFKLDGKRVRTRDEVEEIISQLKRDTPLTITLRRGGEGGTEREVSVKPEWQ